MIECGSGELSSCSGSRGLGGFSPAPCPPPQGPPRRFDGGANIWGRAGVSGLSPTLSLQEARAEPIVGPRPPGPPGRSDMAAHRQWAVARYFKGCPAQSAAPPARPLGLYLWGGDPFSLPQRLTLVAPCGSSSGTTAPQPLSPLPAPFPPHPGPGPPLANVLGPRCGLWVPRVTLLLGKEE